MHLWITECAQLGWVLEKVLYGQSYIGSSPDSPSLRESGYMSLSSPVVSRKGCGL